jgi:hypothetical protein
LTVLTDPTVPQKQKTFRLRWAPRTNATHKGESMTHEESEAVKLTVQCMRCGGPVRWTDEKERLCSDHGCFTVFLTTLQTIGYEVPPPECWSEAWWVETYQHVAINGNVTPLQVWS